MFFSRIKKTPGFYARCRVKIVFNLFKKCCHTNIILSLIITFSNNLLFKSTLSNTLLFCILIFSKYFIRITLENEVDYRTTNYCSAGLLVSFLLPLKFYIIITISSRQHSFKHLFSITFSHI